MCCRKLPSLELLGLHMKPQMWFSGHMGPYLPNHYSLFTFTDDYEFAHRTHQDVGFLLKQHARLSRFWRLWNACRDLLATTADSDNDEHYVLEAMQSLERLQAELDVFHPPPEKNENDEAESEGEKTVGTSTEKMTVRDMVLDIVQHQPVSGLLRDFVLAAADERQMADRARAVFFVAPHAPREKRTKALVPMQGYDSPSPRQIPSRDEMRLIEEGLPYLRVPFPVPEDALVRTHTPTTYLSCADSVCIQHVDNRAKRVPSDWVKSTMFFNLPGMSNWTHCAQGESESSKLTSWWGCDRRVHRRLHVHRRGRSHGADGHCHAGLLPASLHRGGRRRPVDGTRHPNTVLVINPEVATPTPNTISSP
jgi:hypothetical protein